MRRACVVLGIAIAVVVVAVLVERKTPAVRVVVEGRSVNVSRGTTLGALASRLGVRPRAGNLLGVNGKVLRAGAFPGGFVMNGKPAATSTLVHRGDRIATIAGRDRREPRVRLVVRLPAGLPSDPQFFVDRVPGEQVIVRGQESHEVVSSRFKATGVAKPERAVALTFDDGPSPENTPRLLATLRRLHVRATFFVIGYLAQAYPGIVRSEARLGMAVGNHSYNHPDVPPFEQLPLPLIRDEIALDDQVLARLGIHTHLFRPPGGGTSAQVVQVAAALGQRVVLWSVDPTDWQPGITAKLIARRVLAAVRPGSIVELHDGGGDRSATIAALPAIVRGIRARHLRLVTLIAGPGPAVEPTQTG